MSSPLITASNLFCERDDRILFHDLGFTLNSGELVRVVGPNGSGKSTLLRCLVGLFSGYEGQIERGFVDGELEFLGHKLPIKRNLTAFENIDYYSSLGSCRIDKLKREGLVALGMDGYGDTLCSDMSEGQRRRVALAKTLFSTKKVLVLDEPFSSLDAQGVSCVESVLANLSDRGALVVFTTHHSPNLPHMRELSLGLAQGGEIQDD